MAKRLTLAYPGDIQTLTGGYIYDRHLIEDLPVLFGWQVTGMRLDERFPWIDQTTAESEARRLSEVAVEDILVIDGLALGALGDHARLIAKKRPFIALVHHPLALESGLTPEQSDAFRISEQLALSQASAIVVTSPATKQTLLEDYGVSDKPIAVAEPGINQAISQLPAARVNKAPDAAVQILSVGSIVPRKGFDILVQSLQSLKDLNWHLSIVGDKERSAPTTTALQEQIKAAGLSSRIELLGSLPGQALDLLYDSSDMFVLASRFEGYGMAYAEALSWGLPIIGTKAGAVTDTLSATGACLIEPENPLALSHALRELITQPAVRHRMAKEAMLFAKNLGSWDTTARLFSQAITEMSIQ